MIIGLTGLAGAGKDTVADYLVAKHGFTKLSFAEDLKVMLDTLNPAVGGSGIRVMDVRREAGADGERVLKEHFPEYRRLLQVLGTECIRARDEDFWVKQLARKVRQLSPEANIVITDCRFPNEVGSLEQFSFDRTVAFWEVIRPSQPHPPGNAHVSETWAGRMGEAELYNDGTLDDLYQEVDRYLLGLPATASLG